jgi:antitoxin component of MazEF toxin-antitoxin module
MQMAKKTNPRKVTTSGGMTVISLPRELLEETGIQKGDRVVLEADGSGFRAFPVTYEVDRS